MEENMKEIVIDTDVGTDVDDLFALVYAMKSSLLKVKAVCTVHGDTETRARIVKKLERLLGVDIPVIAGEAGNSRYWCGFEHKALTKDELNCAFKNEDYPTYGCDTEIVAIGPLTNIARQLETNPSIRNVKRIYVMGSNDASHNFLADRDAKEIVFAQNWEIYQITRETAEKISFTRKELELLRGNDVGNFLYSSAMNWLDYTGREKSIMYDALAVSSSFEDYVSFREVEKNRFVSYDVDPVLKNKIVEAIKK